MRADRYGYTLAVLLTGCAAAQVHHRMAQRDVDLVQDVRFTSVPPGARFTLEAEAPTERTVLANNVEGNVDIPFAYQAHEAVDNGISHRTDTNRTISISIQAPGYLPRTLTVSIPQTTSVDAALERVPLPAVTISDAGRDDFDAGLERLLSGRCAEATPYLERAKAAATGRHELARITSATEGCDELSVGSPVEHRWDPTSVGVPDDLVESPQSAVIALSTLMAKEKDVVGRKAMDRLALDVQQGHLEDAAKLAELIAQPLPAKRAALVLRLPRALLALGRLRESAQVLASGDSRGALELASEARRIDPLVGPRVYNQVRDARVADLVQRSVQAETGGNPLLARALLYAAGVLDPSALSVRAGLARTRAAALQTVQLRVAIVGDEAVGRQIASQFPDYVAVVDSTANADGVLIVSVDEPRRDHRFERSNRSVEIRVGRVEKPNPEYEPAQERVRDAAERLDNARNESAKLKQQALDSAKQIAAQNSGTWGAVAAGLTASVGEGGGDYLVADAESDLRSARSELARTPRMTSEEVTETAHYPVVSISTTATIQFRVRLEGIGDAADDQGNASAQTSTEEVIGAPEIRVDSSPADITANLALVPDLRPSAVQVGQRLAAHIATFEADAAWTEFAARRQAGDVESAAAIGAAVIDLTGDAHRNDVIAFLLESLP